MEYTHIVAPISGRVSESYIDAGNLVTANSTLLTTIVKSDIVQAYFEASEQDIMRYEAAGIFSKIDQVKLTGPEAKLRLISDPKKTFDGQVTYFDNRMGKGTSSLTMRADIKNPDGVLKAGLFGKLRMKVETNPSAMLVREDVIGTDLVSRYVLVVDKDNKVQYRAVEPGRLVGKFRIIKSGISKDDKIVVKGLHLAVPGRVVNPIKAKMDE